MRTKILTAAVLAAFSVASAHAAHRPHHAARAFKPGAVFHGVVPSGTLTPLYDQFPNATQNGVVSDDSSSSSDSWDAEGADDFVVPASGWTVQQVNFMGFASNGPDAEDVLNDWTATVNVHIYADAGGTPGAVICPYSATPASYDTNTAIISVPLPTPCTLTAGTYWVGLQAVNVFDDTGEQHYLVAASPQTNAMAVWENPGGAFKSPCTSFTPLSDCGYDDPDLAFQILGTPTTPVDLQSFSVD